MNFDFSKYNDIKFNVKPASVSKNNKINTNFLDSYEDIDYSVDVIESEEVDIEKLDIEKNAISEIPLEYREGIKKLSKDFSEDFFLGANDNVLNESENSFEGAKVSVFFKSCAASFVSSFLNLGEGVVDAHIYATALTVKMVSLGKVSMDWGNNAVAYDFSNGVVYEKITSGLSEAEKNSSWAYFGGVIGDLIGEKSGYMALASVPYGGKILCAQAGAGLNVEESINNQIRETGVVNNGKVFFRSIVGSLKGLANGWVSEGISKYFKGNGVKDVVSGAKVMFKDGFKGFVKEFAKSTPAVTKSAVKQYVSNPKVYIKTAANTVETFTNLIYEDNKFSFAVGSLKDPVHSTDFLMNVGESGLEYIINQR